MGHARPLHPPAVRRVDPALVPEGEVANGQPEVELAAPLVLIQVVSVATRHAPVARVGVSGDLQQIKDACR